MENNTVPTIRSRLVVLVMACIVPAFLLAAVLIVADCSLWWLIAGTLILLACVLPLAWRIADRIAASMRSLVEPALALGRGEAVSVPAPGIQEANEVAGALTEASRMLVEARHAASHDALTDLANRAMFDEMLGQQLAACRRTKTNLSVLAIGLDGFNPINDVHGDAAGDDVLRAVAGRLKSGIRESDLAARLGGGEFAVILANSGRDAAVVVCGKLIESLSSPYAIGWATIQISASIGVAVYPESGTTVEVLLQCADKAMYKAKSEAKRHYVEGAANP